MDIWPSGCRQKCLPVSVVAAELQYPRLMQAGHDVRS